MLRPSAMITLLLWALFFLVVGVESPLRAAAADDAQKQAVAAIEKLGGSVHRLAGDSDGWEVEFHLRGLDLTDDGLAHVAALKNVVALNLRDTKITSAGLTHLSGLTKLQQLHLERTQVDDEGTMHLARLVNLEYLNVYATRITDETLARLTGLTKLRRLYVWQTGVTDEGVARLKKKLPRLEVVRGVDLSKLAAYTPYKEDQLKPKATLKWIATSDRGDAPKSQNGVNTEVLFENKSGKHVKVYWVSYGNKLKLYGELDPGGTRRQNTYSSNTWLITDHNDSPLGYFIVDTTEVASAVIPSQ